MIHHSGKEITVLAGDIGGTKTDLAVYSSQSGLRRPLVKEHFPSRDYSGLEAIIHKFLSTHDIRIDHAVFGVAGPVVGGRAKITNLPWVMEEAALAETTGVESVSLLNDVTAFANAVACLVENDLHVINKGSPATKGTMAVVAPGTGLGEAFLVWDGTGCRAFPSEGGHADFAPAGPEQAGLLAYLVNRFQAPGSDSFTSISFFHGVTPLSASVFVSDFEPFPAATGCTVHSFNGFGKPRFFTQRQISFMRAGAPIDLRLYCRYS